MPNYPNASILLVACFAGMLAVACGDDNPPSANGSVTTVAEGEAEEINPCSPEAPPEETALEGDPVAVGAPITDIVATEYRFDEVPATLPAGPHGFRLIGEGEEFHELALIRVDDDRPVVDLLELSEDEQEEATTYIGGVTACPGKTSPEALGVDLEPGRYTLLCFVPVGTSPDLEGDDLLDAYENDPHFTEGMVAEFTVE